MDAPTNSDCAISPKRVLRTLRFKVRTDSRAWLNAAATEANFVWNYCNEISFKALRPYAGKGRWLSGYDPDRCPAGTYYRNLEVKIQQAQRRGHKFQAKRLHRRASRRRQNALHQFSRYIVNRYQYISVGNVSSQALIKTRFAKAVLDCGWASLKRQLQSKGENAGRVVRIVDERNTSRACFACGALSGPTGINGLRVRIWTCHVCGATHDRDVNAARQIRSAGRKPPSVRGNETRCGQRRRAGHNARARHG